MPHLVIRRLARDDVLDHAARIAQDKLEPALRFTYATDDAFVFLSENPLAGARFDPPVENAPDLRFWPVTHFRTYLVIYRPLTDGAEILRVMHGARNLRKAIFQP